MSTIIITPIGNEIHNIPAMYEQIKSLNDAELVWLVVYNDYCTDGTDRYLLQLNEPFIKVLNMGANLGVAQAYLYGIREAITMHPQKIIEVDVGHPVDKIPEFQKLLDKVPVVMGKRTVFVDTLFKRRLLSWIGNKVSKLYLGLPFSDCTSGFQGFTLKVAKNLPLNQFFSSGHFYQTEFKFYCQLLPFAEVPFTYTGGKSSLKMTSIWESIVILFKLPRFLNRLICCL